MGGEHRTLLGGYLGTGGDYKGKDRSRVDERKKETSWNCFLTKFVLPPKAKPQLFFYAMGTPPNEENHFLVW